MGQTESDTPKCHHWKTPRSRDDYVNTAFVDWVQKLWQKFLENPKIAWGLGNLTFFAKNAYQIDPREAVPEVSKSKGYINQEKMCL